MTKPKKRKRKQLTGCPKCGGHWTKVSGLYKCQKCGHNYGSQNPGIDWRHGDVVYSQDGWGSTQPSGRAAIPHIEKTQDDRDSPHPYLESYAHREMKKEVK